MAAIATERSRSGRAFDHPSYRKAALPLRTRIATEAVASLTIIRGTTGGHVRKAGATSRPMPASASLGDRERARMDLSVTDPHPELYRGRI